MNTSNKILAAVCWWFPPVALIVLFMRDMPSLVRRHAWWALGYAILAFAIVVVIIGLGIFGISGAVTFGVVGGIGVFVTFAVLIANTVAALLNRGPFLMS